MAKNIRLVGMAAAVLPLTLLVACSSSAGSSSSALPPTSPSAAANPSTGGTTVSETGSTLLLPLVSAWQVAFGTLNPNVLVTTSGTGSGTGISDAAAGTVDIGGSDAYLSPADTSQHPGVENIPLAVAALMVNYKVPGINGPLRLSGKFWPGSTPARSQLGMTRPSARSTQPLPGNVRSIAQKLIHKIS